MPDETQPTPTPAPAPTSTQPVIPPAPWYTSPVQVNAVIALGAQAVSIVFRYIEPVLGFKLTPGAIDMAVADLSQLAAVVFAFIAIAKRQTSPVAPLTFTAKGAESKAAANPPILPTDPTKEQK